MENEKETILNMEQDIKTDNNADIEIKGQINIVNRVIGIAHALLQIILIFLPWRVSPGVSLRGLEITAELGFFSGKHSGYLVMSIPITAAVLVLILYIFKNKLRALRHAGSLILFMVSALHALIVLFIGASLILLHAASSQFFISLTPFFYFSMGAAGMVLLYQTGNLVNWVNTLSAGYGSFQAYKAAAGKKISISIKTKLITAFIFTMMSIIISMSVIVLRQYKKTITNAVIQTGLTQSEQAAGMFSANNVGHTPGDLIEIETYLQKVIAKNNKSEFRFERLDLYTFHREEGDYFQRISTDKSASLKRMPEAYKRLGMETKVIMPSLRNPYFHFVSPIYLSKKLIGFGVIIYTADTIYTAYFKTMLFIILISIVCAYVSVCIFYTLGSRITLPIQFLQMNVNKISRTLELMVGGKISVSAQQLVYEDAIRSRDETRQLSNEIHDMVGVIKSIIPYVSFSTLQQAKSDGSKTSSKREMTFLFTDIRGFTSLCEGMDPQEVVGIINHYLDLQTDIIIKNGGDVDKFMGDCIMAQFSGPEKEQNACRVNFEIRKAMRHAADERTVSGQTRLSIGIGINTGEVTFGSIGAKNRMDFTAIGDTVNLASRLESANKTYETTNLISEAVFEKVKDIYFCRQIDYIAVKGKNKPVTIYELLCASNDVNDKIRDIAESFEKGLSLYRAQKWSGAAKAFSYPAETYQDKPSLVFLKRIAHFEKNPPDKKWDGIFVMSGK